MNRDWTRILTESDRLKSIRGKLKSMDSQIKTDSSSLESRIRAFNNTRWYHYSDYKNAKLPLERDRSSLDKQIERYNGFSASYNRDVDIHNRNVNNLDAKLTKYNQSKANNEVKRTGKEELFFNESAPRK